MTALQALGIAEHCLPADAFVFCVISGKRSERVPQNMTKFKKTGAFPTFFVADNEGPAYRGYIGMHPDAEKMVVESGRLCPSRNAALAHAEKNGKICVQMSDDIQHLTLHVLEDAAKRWTMEPPTADEVEERVAVDVANQRAKDSQKFALTPIECAQIIQFQMQRHNAKLGGTCIHGNGGFAFSTAFVAVDSFILGDFMVIDTRTKDTPRFDLRMSLKEDYDVTAAHLHKYGVACRVHQILIAAEHRRNTGGAVFYRSRSLELAHIQFLKAKWPGVFSENFSRQGPTRVVSERTLPFMLERRDAGFVIVELGMALRERDSMVALCNGMRLIKIEGEDLRKTGAALKTALDSAEEMLYGARDENGTRRSPKRPVELVFGFTPECPPIEVVMHWDKRDVSLGGQKEVEKTEFPSTEALQRKVAQHSSSRQPSMHEFLLKKQEAKKVQESASRCVTPRPATVETPDSAKRLKELLNPTPKPEMKSTPIGQLLKTTTPARKKRDSPAGKEPDKNPRVDIPDKKPRVDIPAKPHDELLEQGVELFMSGQTMGEITKLLSISETDLRQYMKAASSQ